MNNLSINEHNVTQNNGSLQQNIAAQHDMLTGMLKEPLHLIAEKCCKVWGDRIELDNIFITELKGLPEFTFLYALDTDAIQISDNVSHEGIIKKDFGRDRRERPYMREVVPSSGFLLSNAYISIRARRPSLTAIQLVRDTNGKTLGFIGADFDLRDLPLTKKLYEEPHHWQQIKGDPSIRGTVFHQTRVESKFDRHMDVILTMFEELIRSHGLFHVILHFSSSRAVVWLYDDPYRYRLLDIESLMDPNICLAYPIHKYPEDSVVPEEKIFEVFESFKNLRFMDDTLYLRSGTLNIFNGIVGLTFSCDGSHYIPYEEFLNRDHAFWANESATN
ncbi:MAG: PDC sensor domain-containing protein [Thiohalomonadales bacterium]